MVAHLSLVLYRSKIVQHLCQVNFVFFPLALYEYESS